MVTTHENTDFYSRYREQLAGVLTQICARRGYGGEKLFKVEELEEKWPRMAPGYMPEALANLQDYPSVSLAWAAYVGMGMAKLWDADWAKSQQMGDFYGYFANPRGFDCLDEFVMEECLGLIKETPPYQSLVSLCQELSESALSMMRKENVSPQSADAYFLLTHTVEIFYQVGISVALSLMGYSYQKVTIGG